MVIGVLLMGWPMARNRPQYPVHTVHWKTRAGELLEGFWCDTEITGYEASTAFIELHPDGPLILMPGYQWDFGSGPAIDTPEMILSSLVHDAFYELLALNLISNCARKKSDRLLRIMLKESGAGWFRSWYVWAAVRAFGGKRG